MRRVRAVIGLMFVAMLVFLCACGSSSTSANTTEPTATETTPQLTLTGDNQYAL